MKNAEWAESFSIFAKYEDAANTAAEHDEFYAGPSAGTAAMAAEDVARLEELGWRADPNGGFAIFP